MIAIVSGSLVIVLAVVIVRWFAAAPILRALSTSIDCWADDLHGNDAPKAG